MTKLSLVILLIVYFISCSSSLSNIELKKEYGFASKKSIITYVIPTGNIERDESYIHVLFLDLQARGYKVIDANNLLIENSDKITSTNHREIADSLQLKEYLPDTDVYVIAQPAWDSAFVLTYYSESSTRDWVFYAFNGM
ncbi:MAG TPA: hypothetical protein VIZ21_00735 [Ignavibacteriaceae bacterium]